MSHDKIRDAARRRMAATGESYAVARRRVMAEREAAGPAGGLSAEDIRAAAAAHEQLGPEYSDAVVASFLEKVEDEVNARVDARLGAAGSSDLADDPGHHRTLLKGVAIGFALGVVMAIAVGGNSAERIHRLVLVMLILAVICAIGASRPWESLRKRVAPSARAGRTEP
jgi:hypothetical protein